MKHILGRFFFVVAALCIFTPSAHAQNQDMPMIYVQDFHISTTTLTAGAIVPGSATLVNKGNADIADVSYIATIVGNYKGNDPYTTFDTKNLGKVYVPAHSSKKIEFAYQIPIYLNGMDYGMELTAGLDSGHLLGWGSVRIKIKGFSEHILSLNGTVLDVGKASFAPGMGPTVHAGEAAAVSAIVINQSNAPFKVYSQFAVYNRTIDGAKVYSSSTRPILLPVGQETTLTQSLPDLLSKPGVYAFSWKFYDAAGNEVGPPVEGRFIEGGYIATIQSVNADEQLVKDGDVVQVKVIYEGTPVDLVRPEAFRGATATMLVKLYNQNDDLVSEASQEVSLDASGATESFAMTAKKGAHALRAEVEVKKDGKIIGIFGKKLSESYDSLRGTKENSFSFSTFRYIALFLVIVGLIVLLLHLRKISRHAGMAMIVLSIGFLGASAIVSAGTYTGTTYNPYTKTLSGPSIVVNTPLENQEVVAGAPVNIEVRVTAGECNNEPADLATTVTFNGVNKSFYAYRQKLQDCHHYGTCQDVDVAIHQTATIIAPLTTGDYNINVSAVTHWYYTPTETGTSNYSFPIHISDACPNIVGTQVFPPPGTHYDPVSMMCIDNCPAGQHNDPVTHQCVNNVDLCPNIAGVQNVMPAGYHFDSGLNKCIPDCLIEGTHYDDAVGKCVNNGGDVCPNIPGSQQYMPANKYLDPETGWCIDLCPAGQHNDSATHLCVTSCPAGQHWNTSANMCENDSVCPANTHWDAGTQVCISNDCPAGQHKDGGGICVYDNCAAGLHRDSVSHMCVGDCPSGTTWDSDAQQCFPNPGSCPVGQHIDTNSASPTYRLCINNTDVCTVAGQHLDQVASSTTYGTCINDGCPADMYYDVGRGFCVRNVHYCPSSYHWSEAYQTCVPNVPCVEGSTCTATTVNQCGQTSGRQSCTSSGPVCVPYDAGGGGSCTACTGGRTLCNGVCLSTPICPPPVSCLAPNGKVILEGQSILLYDIKKGTTATNNCSSSQADGNGNITSHQERRTCIIDYRDPLKSSIVVPKGSPIPSGYPGGGTIAAYTQYFSASNSTGILSGDPNPYDDKHVYGSCSPFFQEI